MSIQTLAAPSIRALIPDKANAFDFMFWQLRALLLMLSTANTTALANHFHVSHSVTCSEITTITATIEATLFKCKNLSGICSLNSTGAKLSNISDDITMRPDDIAFFIFDMIVMPTVIDPHLSLLSTHSGSVSLCCYPSWIGQPLCLAATLLPTPTLTHP
jgi:predicted permease